MGTRYRDLRSQFLSAPRASLIRYEPALILRRASIDRSGPHVPEQKAEQAGGEGADQQFVPRKCIAVTTQAAGGSSTQTMVIHAVFATAMPMTQGTTRHKYRNTLDQLDGNSTFIAARQIGRSRTVRSNPPSDPPSPAPPRRPDCRPTCAQASRSGPTPSC